MKNVNRLWGVLLLVVFVTGCPDGPPQILRDERNAAAEVADYLSKVTDEESATVALAIAERLKTRWEAIKKRRENYIKLAEKQENAYFLFLQDPVKASGALGKSVVPKERLLESASQDYSKEITACMTRLQNDGRRVALLPIADPKVAADIRQFESSVFGGPLKMPEDPIQIETGKEEKFAAMLVKALRYDADGGGGPSAYGIGQIVGYVVLGLLGVAVVFWLLTKK